MGVRKTTSWAEHGERTPAWEWGPRAPGEDAGGVGSDEVGSFDSGPLPPAVISLPITYRRLVRGLCGNYDQNKRNDFMLPNGALTQNLLVFGNSWEVKKTKGGLPRFSR